MKYAPPSPRGHIILNATYLLVLPCGHRRTGVNVTIAEVRHIPRTIQSSISGGGVVTSARSRPPSSPASHSARAPLTPITPRSINCHTKIWYLSNIHLKMNFIQLKRNNKTMKKNQFFWNLLALLNSWNKQGFRLTYANLGVAVLRGVCAIAHTVASAILRGGIGARPVPPLGPSTARDGAVPPGSPGCPLTVNYIYQLCL